MESFLSLARQIYFSHWNRELAAIVQQKAPCGLLVGGSYADTPMNVCEAWDAMLHKVGVNLKTWIVPLEEDKGMYSQRGHSCISIEQIRQQGVPLRFAFAIPDRTLEAFHTVFRSQGVRTLTLSSSAYMDSWLGTFFQTLPAQGEVYESLTDDASREALAGYLRGKSSQSPDEFVYAPEPQYFLGGWIPKKGDILIDGGAYDGGTGMDYVLAGADVYSFEMDVKNYQNCQKRAKDYGFIVENYGLWSSEGSMNYITGDAASSVTNAGDAVGNFISIDRYVELHHLPRIDYIKLDIEGAELEALKGAAKSIIKWKPAMALSAYHRPEDTWRLASYLRSLRPDYEFAFRHYAIDSEEYLTVSRQKEILRRLGMDLHIETPYELVMYCR